MAAVNLEKLLEEIRGQPRWHVDEPPNPIRPEPEPEGVVIFRGTDTGRNGNRILLKCLLMEQSSPRALKKAKKETLGLLGLLHDNILRLEGVFATVTHLVLVLEDWGITLQQFLANYGEEHGRPLPEEMAKKIFQQMVLPVLFLQLKGCYHRDLHLGNYLIENEKVKLIALGNIKRFVPPHSTNSTSGFGTDGYKAPEIWSGIPGNYDEKIDAWSLGVCLWNMLCATPFDAKAFITSRLQIPETIPAGAAVLLKGLLVTRVSARLSVVDIFRNDWFNEGLDPALVQKTRNLAGGLLHLDAAFGGDQVPISEAQLPEEDVQDALRQFTG